MPMPARRRYHFYLVSWLVPAVFVVSLIHAYSFGIPSTKTCKIRVCHNKDCAKKGGGELLLDTFRDLLPAPLDGSGGAGPGVLIESSGCLSRCGSGPNVLVENGKNEDEKIYFGVNDPTTASAVLEVATGEEYPITLLVAATSISQAGQATSPSKKEELLSSAIETLTKDNDATLLNSFAHAHALFLRADARLDLSALDVDGAIADAMMASKLAPKERKVWRVLASALEAGGHIKEAMDAVREWSTVNPEFSTKAKNEMARLAKMM